MQPPFPQHEWGLNPYLRGLASNGNAVTALQCQNCRQVVGAHEDDIIGMLPCRSPRIARWRDRFEFWWWREADSWLQWLATRWRKFINKVF